LFHSLPNLLTALRLALAPMVIAALLEADYGWALALALTAGVTDALDGFFARRFGWTSRLGAYLDPLADKLLLVSIYFVLGYERIAPRWLVGLVFGRDFLILLMVGVGFFWKRVSNFPPSVWGKISTACQVITALVILANQAFPPARWPQRLLIWATALATVWSGLHYAWRGWRVLGNLRIDGGFRRG
jgi:cardiolipin synthase